MATDEVKTEYGWRFDDGEFWDWSDVVVRTRKLTFSDWAAV